MAFFFVDSLDAYHFDEVINCDGSRSNSRNSAPFLSDFPCQLSFSGHEATSPKGKVKYPEQRQLEIFVKGIGHGFKRGDWIIVKRRGAAIYEGAISEPRIYDRLIVHTELVLDAWKEISNG